MESLVRVLLLCVLSFVGTAFVSVAVVLGLLFQRRRQRPDSGAEIKPVTDFVLPSSAFLHTIMDEVVGRVAPDSFVAESLVSAMLSRMGVDPAVYTTDTEASCNACATDAAR